MGKDLIPKFVPNIDPYGPPVEVTLEQRNLEEIGPKNQLRGTVVNPEGEAIPNAVVFVYGLMDSVRPYGALPEKRIRLRADGSILDVGELSPVPGNRIVGEVILSDGEPIPFGTKVVLSRDGAWDSTAVDIDPSGQFNMSGIPEGSVTVSVRVPNYRFSEKNKSLDRLNGGSLVGQIAHDIIGLKILLEPGQFVHPDFRILKDFEPSMQPRDEPLRGAETTGL
ncbi:MAG: carboxypeptidase-like regulatory domain-containing protein [Verrucomicrobia bacterium]|nr:carboxypeptidase-like regulatory domain-containing protein [Verrucomicrobiota bacterium]